nr:outer membrane beta-barrel protein [Bacteroidota bacterium]
MKKHLCLILFILSQLYIHGVCPLSSGSIRGILIDSLKEPVPGVIISIENTPYKTLTDINGSFSLFNIPPGNYKLTINALGFEKIIIDIRLDVDQQLDLKYITLKTSATNLNEISITEEMPGEAKAINLTKTSPRLVTITSSEEISKLPNKNAADVVAHNPGVAVQRNKGENSIVSIRGTPSDWSAVLVNGDRLPVACEENTTRSFEFEAFPASLIDHVVESRTVTPDMESDNIGGSINFFTKDPDYKKSVGLDIAGGISALANKPTASINAFLENVSKNKKFGVIINLSCYSRYYASDAQKVVFGSNFNHGINRLELRRYDGYRNTLGGNIAMEYKFNSAFKMGTHFFAGRMTDDKQMKKQSFDWFDDSGQRIRLQNAYGKLIREIIGGDIYAEYKPTQRINLKVRVASYDNRFGYGTFPIKNKNDNRNGFYVMEFMGPTINYTDRSKTDANGNTIDPNSTNYILLKLIGNDEPYGNGDNPKNIQPHYSNILQAKDFQYTQSYTEGNNTHESDPIVGQMDLQYKINNLISLQLGGKYREKQGYRHITKHDWFQNYAGGSSAPILLTDFETRNFSHSGSFLKEQGGNYEPLLMPFLTMDAMNGFVDQYNNKLREVYMNELNSEYRFWVGSNYDYHEQQAAGYAQLDYNTDKLNILAGVRIEHTKLFEESDTLTNNTAYDVATSTYYFLPEKRYTHLKYTGILPSINATFYLDSITNLLLAASQTMHRPNFEETKPGYAVIRYNDLEYTFGNPHLRPAYSINLDLNLQHFFGTRGMWSVGSYFKKIKDHI